MRVLRSWVISCLAIVCTVTADRHKRQEVVFGGGSRESDCNLPTGEPGNCIPLPDCIPYAERSLRLRENIEFLRQVTCRYDRFHPIVCCPTKGSGVIPPDTPRPPTPRPPSPRPPTTGEVPCGRGGNMVLKVVGGANATAGDWPWAAAIFMDDSNGVPQLSCGGSLLNRQYILTAGHCTMNKAGVRHPIRSFSVRLGDLNLQSDKDDDDVIVSRVSDVITHPDFNPANFHNDIALMKLDAPINYNDMVKPVCLPTSADANNNFEGKHPILLGWGTTGFEQAASPILQYLQIDVQSQPVCRQSYRIFSATHPIIPSQMCAGALNGGKDACQGDSGGPLQMEDSSRKDSPYMVIGVVSFGFRCAERGFPGIYTRVTSFLDWINSNIRQ